MSDALIAIAAVIVGVLLAIPISLYATRGLRRNTKRSRGFALASALFFAFPFFGGRGPELIVEAKDTARRKKDAESGDPPVTGSEETKRRK